MQRNKIANTSRTPKLKDLHYIINNSNTTIIITITTTTTTATTNVPRPKESPFNIWC